MVESKVGSYRELVKRLNADGMKMTWEEVLDNGGNPVQEDQVQKKMIFELIARKGYQKDWSAAKTGALRSSWSRIPPPIRSSVRSRIRLK